MAPRLTAAIPHVALAAALMIVVGWPSLATILAATEGDDVASRGGLMTPPSSAFGSADVPRAARLAGETLRLVAATEAVALPVGVLLGLLLFRTRIWGRSFLIGVLAVAVFVPMPLNATAWLGAFGNVGRARMFGMSPWLEGWYGAAFVHAMATLPWVAILAGIGLRTVEVELEEQAALDLPPWRVALKITLRRALGPIGGAALAVAILTAGDMTVTDLLQVRTYAEEAYFQYQLGKGPGAAGATALPPLIVLGCLLLAGARGVFAFEPERLASASAKGRLGDLGRYRPVLSAATWILVSLYVVLPVASLVWHAGRVGGSARLGRLPGWSLHGLFGSLAFAWDDARGALASSFLLAALGATFATLLAWSLAWVSREPGPWRWVTALASALSLAAPAPVAGMALVLAYRSFGTLYDSAAMIALVDTLRTFPYALLILWPAIRLLPRHYFEAAALEGLSAWGTIRRVALPLTRPATLAAWGVAFVLSLGELPATQLATPPGITPITVVIWSLLHNGVESRLAGIVLIMLAAVALAALLTAGAIWRLNQPRWRRAATPTPTPEPDSDINALA